MAILARGYTFGASETVTNSKLHSLVDSGTVSSIQVADFGTGIRPVSIAATAPSSPTTGDLWLDTSITYPAIKRYTGSAWVQTGGTSAFSANKNSTNQTGVVSATETKVTWSAEEFDLLSEFDSTTNSRFTPTQPGIYLLSSAVRFTVSVDTAVAVIILYKNGVAYQECNYLHEATTKQIGVAGSWIVQANGTTDYFEIYAYHDTGANRTIDGTAKMTWFTGAKLA